MSAHGKVLVGKGHPANRYPLLFGSAWAVVRLAKSSAIYKLDTTVQILPQKGSNVERDRKAEISVRNMEDCEGSLSRLFVSLPIVRVVFVACLPNVDCDVIENGELRTSDDLGLTRSQRDRSWLEKALESRIATLEAPGVDWRHDSASFLVCGWNQCCSPALSLALLSASS